ncbi:hypothetical protein [Kitasatospora sp. Root107]|uniref:hypothetical protein n=1 Tax=Kitasatospora sp. Root107 TaxID=1736424 RepID=UPI00071121A4|nr:hypothetical protein [Kitasatospora sp. Root107]KQV11888.1 hypothetical protein ASC99_35835 [Kitasatospora sp. Root107]
MKYLAYLLGSLSAAGATIYLIVYLYRWEWHRALLSAVLLLVVEGVLICAVLLSRIARLERQVAEADARTEDVRRRLAQTRETPQRQFQWLDPAEDDRHRTYVFIPVLLVAGALFSGAAWVIQRIARVTGRGAERRLAGRLTDLTAPVPREDGRGLRLEDRPAVPRRRPARTTLAVAGLLAAALVLGLGVDRLEDIFQTRSEPQPDSAASVVVFEVTIKQQDDPRALEIAAGSLWEYCRRSTAARLDAAPLSRLDDGIYVGVVRPALQEHDLLRLHGCLEDAALSAATARVLGEGQAATGDMH